MRRPARKAPERVVPVVYGERRQRHEPGCIGGEIQGWLFNRALDSQPWEILFAGGYRLFCNLMTTIQAYLLIQGILNRATSRSSSNLRTILKPGIFAKGTAPNEAK